MECTNCGQWNPEDKDVCWRCQTELPRPVEKKKKGTPKTIAGLPIWLWVAGLLLISITMFGQCLRPPI